MTTGSNEHPTKCDPMTATGKNPLELKVPPVIQVAVAALAMWVIARFTPSFDWPVAARSGGALPFLIAGAWTALAGVSAFRRANTTVNPMTPEISSALVDSGIYRFTRNPMYLGFLFWLLGWAVFLASPWTLAGPVVFVAWMTRFQIVPEERTLAQYFGRDYTNYTTKVRRWL